MWLVLGHGAVLVVAGIVAGAMASSLVTRTIAKFFPLVGGSDIATFAGVTALLAGIALAACYLPAWRAIRVDPIAALRHE